MTTIQFPSSFGLVLDKLYSSQLGTWPRGSDPYYRLFEKLEEEDDDSLLEPSPYLWCLDWELLVVDMVKSKERLSEVKEEESKDWGKLDGSATVKKGYLNW